MVADSSPAREQWRHIGTAAARGQGEIRLDASPAPRFLTSDRKYPQPQVQSQFYRAKIGPNFQSTCSNGSNSASGTASHAEGPAHRARVRDPGLRRISLCHTDFGQSCVVEIGLCQRTKAPPLLNRPGESKDSRISRAFQWRTWFLRVTTPGRPRMRPLRACA